VNYATPAPVFDYLRSLVVYSQRYASLPHTLAVRFVRFAAIVALMLAVAGALLGANGLDSLNDVDEARLIRLARAAVRAEVTGAPLPPSVRHAPAVPAARPVFVTIERGSNGAVIGCRGALICRERSLQDEVVRAARAAASHDPRYRPLTPGDLTDFRVTVTIIERLVPLEPAQVHTLAPNDGLVLQAGARTGVVLPWEGKDPRSSARLGLQKGGRARRLGLFAATHDCAPVSGLKVEREITMRPRVETRVWAASFLGQASSRTHSRAEAPAWRVARGPRDRAPARVLGRGTRPPRRGFQPVFPQPMFLLVALLAALVAGPTPILAQPTTARAKETIPASPTPRPTSVNLWVARDVAPRSQDPPVAQHAQRGSRYAGGLQTRSDERAAAPRA
jgi:hypothetical protein